MHDLPVQSFSVSAAPPPFGSSAYRELGRALPTYKVKCIRVRKEGRKAVSRVLCHFQAELPHHYFHRIYRRIRQVFDGYSTPPTRTLRTLLCLPTHRFYVDFSTKVVTAERLLWERALKAGSSGGEGGQSKEDEGAFVMVVAPVIEKLVSIKRHCSSGDAWLYLRVSTNDFLRGDERVPERRMYRFW